MIDVLRRYSQPRPLTIGFAALWLICLADWMWSQWLMTAYWIYAVVFPLSLPVFGYWALKLARIPHATRVRQSAVGSLFYIPVWQTSVFLCDSFGWFELRSSLALSGTFALFFLGLAWAVWSVDRESQKFDQHRRNQDSDESLNRIPGSRLSSNAAVCRIRSNNPLDTTAWYYGHRNQKLNQSMTVLICYSLSFLVAFILATQLGGCQETYESPLGGGVVQTLPQTVKIQKVIKRKFVINPFSAISFKIPPIENIKLNLLELTKHRHVVGQGVGEGAGFSGGTKKGKVRFIRLEYIGGDWDQDFGVSADQNMLLEYNKRTQQKVAKLTESRTIGQLKLFRMGKSPPLVYLTGQRNISLSNNEIKILREYLLEKHGMLFGDNGGSAHFHNQFMGMMRRVLPDVRHTRVPLDDRIHRIPYQIPFLPYVAPHGGKEALGWRVDGRLVCYYHPGDIGDAWTDDHSGVSPEIWEACYQLGTNVIFYAHVEYNKWLTDHKSKR
ncbi:MAG: DUF4159 domain-containing protein [Planctomycetaceae bacterium]